MGEPDGTMATNTPCLSASCSFVRLVCVPRPLASDSLSYSLMRSGAALSRATTCGGSVVYNAAMRTWSSSPGSVRFRSRSCTVHSPPFWSSWSMRIQSGNRVSRPSAPPSCLALMYSRGRPSSLRRFRAVARLHSACPPRACAVVRASPAMSRHGSSSASVGGGVSEPSVPGARWPPRRGGGSLSHHSPPLSGAGYDHGVAFLMGLYTHT